MKPSWICALLCACLLFAGQLRADGYLYDCRITDKGARVQWISDVLAIVVPQDGKIKIVDAVSLHFERAPVTVRVSKNNDRQMVLRWKLKGLKDSSSVTIPSFDYTARLDKSTLGILLEANPRGFSQRWIGRGKCARIDKK